MSTYERDEVEQGLATLTQWRGPEERVWEAALKQEDVAVRAAARRRTLRGLVRPMLGVAALLAVATPAALWAMRGSEGPVASGSAESKRLALVQKPAFRMQLVDPSPRDAYEATLVVPLPGGADVATKELSRDGVRLDSRAAQEAHVAAKQAGVGAGGLARSEHLALAGAPAPDSDNSAGGAGVLIPTPALPPGRVSEGQGPGVGQQKASVPAGARAQGATQGQVQGPAQGIPMPDALAARQVVRRASIGIETDDFDNAVKRVSACVDDARGEFLESSNLVGAGGDAVATMTLRVISTRFGEVLGVVRSLGHMRSENATGDDVTDQIIDLDARVRNERQVERELLALVEARRSSPLKEIMELREQLSRVRVNIERLVGSADTLSRRVTLATITVEVRHPQVRQEAAPPTGGAISRAWSDGVGRLVSALAGTIEWALASLLWLVAGLMLVPIVLGVWRRAVRFSMLEPVPRV